MNKTLTIFTPTYNRAYSLPQLYNSMILQRCKDFLWLIVDDGSTDETSSLVRSWQEENIVEIVYIKQENGGKMRAHNRGVSACTTPLFFCIDSDDYLTDCAVERIISLYPQIKNCTDICGILAKRDIVNRESSVNMPKADKMTMHDLYTSGFKGDTSIVFKTDVIKKYLFPEIEGEKFITEAYVYDQIDQTYQYMIVDEAFMVCEYQEDGYTVNAKKLQILHPLGWALYYAQHYKFYAKTMRDKLKYMGYYIAAMKQAKQGWFKTIKKAPSAWICLLSVPIGGYFFRRDYK